MRKLEYDSVPERLYRFRPLTIVKPDKDRGVRGKTVVEELAEQEIFVARLDELNDPMDGLHHTVWDGDSIVWKNFVRNYALCLLDAVMYVLIAGDTAPLDTDAVHTLKTPDDSPTEKHRALCEDLIQGVQRNHELQSLLINLIRKEKFRQGDLLALLTMYQMSFLREVTRSLKSHRIRPANRVADVAFERVYSSAPWQPIDLIDPIDRLVLNG
jgi:hypothetical protein